MKILKRPTRVVAVFAAAALVLAACGGNGDGDDTETAAGGATATAQDTPDDAATATATATDEGGETTATEAAGGDVTTARGITAEPCPDGDPDRGCIYLGTISDLSIGPFAALGVPITEAQHAFWQKVNDDGGIGGAYDVNSTDNVEDAEYNAQVHAEAYENIRGDVLALTQTLGSSQTLGVMDAMQSDSMVAVPMTWWSGWDFNPLILQSGGAYCVDGMNSVDYGAAEGVESIAIVGFPGDYGEDYAAGANMAAEANGIDVLGEVQQVPVSAGGDTAGTVTELAGMDPAPDAVMLAVGPNELGEIAGGLAQQGFEGRYFGAAPTYNGALLSTPVAPVLESSYLLFGAFAPYAADTPAHQALQAAVPEPANDGATFGWMMSYPMLSVLEQAHADGDLTPEGVATAATQAVVDYQGALPDLELSGTPAEQMVRQSNIGMPDDTAGTGMAFKETFTGDTAANHPFEEPCFDLG